MPDVLPPLAASPRESTRDEAAHERGITERAAEVTAYVVCTIIAGLLAWPLVMHYLR